MPNNTNFTDDEVSSVRLFFTDYEKLNITYIFLKLKLYHEYNFKLKFIKLNI